jgi:DNA-binding transcriptional LysR family regulator
LNISTRQLTAFVHVAKLRSFSKAAERLHITPAGISFSIRELEGQLNSRLLERTTRSVNLTEAGVRLLPVAERLVSDLQAAILEVNEVETRSRQTIRLGATPLICNKIIPRAFHAFRREYPHVKLQVLELQRDAIQDLVASGELDIGFGIFMENKVGIERTRMFSSMLYLVTARTGTSAGDSLARIKKIRWGELGSMPLVGLQPHNAFQQLIDRHLPAATRDNAEHTCVNHIETQIALAEIGIGAAIIPSFALGACRHYKVTVRELIDPVVHVDFFRIARKGVAKSEHFDAFTQKMADTVKNIRRVSPG